MKKVLCLLLSILLACSICSCADEKATEKESETQALSASESETEREDKTSSLKIILDTDFGDDIDDNFALGYLLKEVPDNIELVLTCYGKTEMRAAIAAEFLSSCGYTDIEIGKGKANSGFREPYQYKFCEYNIKDYENYTEDGIDRALEIIKADPENTVILALGPATNLAEMINREPELMKNVRVIAMFGSIAYGYYGNSGAEPEYNVFADVAASKTIISSLNNLTITPLDTCGLLHIEREGFDKLKNSDDIITKTVITYYNNWFTFGYYDRTDCTSCLYDTLPVYMLLDGEGLVYNSFKLAVDDTGKISVSQTGNKVKCAMKWETDTAKSEFLNKLVDVFTN